MSTKNLRSLLDIQDELERIIDQVEFLALGLGSQTIANALDARQQSGLMRCVCDISTRLEDVNASFEAYSQAERGERP
jgi:hypothetical protein